MDVWVYQTKRNGWLRGKRNMCGDLRWQLEKVDHLEKCSQNEWKKNKFKWIDEENLIYELLGQVTNFLGSNKTEITTHLHNPPSHSFAWYAKKFQFSTILVGFFSREWLSLKFSIPNMLPFLNCACSFGQLLENIQQKHEPIEIIQVI